MLLCVATQDVPSTTDAVAAAPEAAASGLPAGNSRRRRWTALIVRLLPATTLVVALCAVATISLVAFEEAHVVDVTIQSRLLKDVVLTSIAVNDVKPAAQGFVVFDFLGAVNRSVAGLKLNIHSARESVWYAQPCCEVSGGSFFGTAQLGSDRWPLREDERYTFQLLTAPGEMVLAEGTIHAGVTAVETTPPWARWALAWLAALATVMQLGQTTYQAVSLIEARTRTRGRT
jgi:hypothetical protein